MGLSEKNLSNSKFLSLKHGGICLESKEPIEGYEKIDVKNPSLQNDDGTDVYVTKYIKKYAALFGTVKRLEWYDREDAGVRYLGLKIHVKDGSETFILDLPFGKRHFDYFTKVMDNIDFSTAMEFAAWADRKDKRQTAFLIKQNGEILPWAYTKDNMGECPPAKQDVMGKWDFRDQRIWLFERLKNVIIPKVEALNEFEEPEPEYDEEVDPKRASAAFMPDSKTVDLVPPDDEIGRSIPF